MRVRKSGKLLTPLLYLDIIQGVYDSGSQPFETRGPLTSFVIWSRTTTEYCVTGTLYNVYLSIRIKAQGLLGWNCNGGGQIYGYWTISGEEQLNNQQ